MAATTYAELLTALTRLLHCPDLNQDELDPETQNAIDAAQYAVDQASSEILACSTN